MRRSASTRIRTKLLTMARSMATGTSSSTLPWSRKKTNSLDLGEGDDVLVDVPNLPDSEPSEAQTLGDTIKALIPDPAARIKLAPSWTKCCGRR